MVKVDKEEAQRLGLKPFTETEATVQVENILSNWDKPSEVWALRYGSYFPALVASLPPIFLTRNIRNAHKLQKIATGHLFT